MEDFKKLLKQYWQFGFVLLVVVILLTVTTATSGDPRQAGSSYNIAANGYGAWYQMMLDRGVKIQRWKKPFAQLVKDSTNNSRETFLQVNSQLEELDLNGEQQEWVKSGNSIVVLGINATAGDLPFQSDVDSFQGAIRIETTRRFIEDRNWNLPIDAIKETVLSDKYGSVINQFKLGKGRVIIATTPHLAANAYQDFRPNYELLAKIVSPDRQTVIIDEYSHGYRDRLAKAAANTGDVLDYLLHTPLGIVLLNICLGILILFWQQNRRFGRIIIPKPPEIENSEAYIQALGGVLQQANSSEFVLQNVGKATQLNWQRQLGLGGERLVEPSILIAAWENQIKLPTDDLRSILELVAQPKKLTPKELNIWLKKIQSIIIH